MGARISRDEPDPMEISSVSNGSHRSVIQTQHEASNILKANVRSADANDPVENEIPKTASNNRRVETAVRMQRMDTTDDAHPLI